jgi:hypothetical protein
MIHGLLLLLAHAQFDDFVSGSGQPFRKEKRGYVLQDLVLVSAHAQYGKYCNSAR